MPLTVGSRLGPYEITAKLGAGGMGEVWRATDTSLKRDVALKLLPEEFNKDPERLARFEREAHLLAQLNHPNIAHVYGLEKSGDTRALVMELVEGSTLAERLEHGSLPVDESLSLARQLAEALEEAHEKGIIHRDLKPANIKASIEGKVKVLDFGLAKAFEAKPLSEMSPSHLAHSPTLTLGGTIEGVILGTAAYMAPEQAKGLVVDKRADIWAFGVVLYEMLTGKPLFAGDSVPDTLARVLQREVDFEALPKPTPPAIRRLLRHCLERQPKNRLHDVADARLVIDDALAGRGESAEAPARGAVGLALRLVPWMLFALTAAALLLVASRPTRRPKALRGQFEISLPPGRQLDALYRRAVALSPDGRTIAVITSGAEHPPADPISLDRRIELRALDDSTFRPVAGTEGAFELAFSPDGKWLAFSVFKGFTEGLRAPYNELRKVPVEGGRPTTLCRNRGGWGLFWSAGGWVAFGGPDGAIQRVRADGGAIEPLSSLFDRSEAAQQIHPLALPGGRSWLFSEMVGQLNRSAEPLRIRGLKQEGLASTLVLDGATDPRFVPPDHLLYAEDGKVRRIPFDRAQLKVSGEPTTIVDGVAQSVATTSSLVETAQAQYDVAVDGTLVYGPGSIAPSASQELVWVGPTGREKALDLPPDPYLLARIARDGRRVLLSMVYRHRQLEIYDPDRGTRRRLMTRGSSTWAIWGPGPGEVTFASDHEGLPRIYVANVDGPADSARPLFEAPLKVYDDGPSSWSADGNRLLFVAAGESSTQDVWLYERGQQPRPYLATRFSERYPEFSPDGRWVAYVSNETGTSEVWARSFAGEGTMLQVSVGGGIEPAWSRDGRSIFYRGFERVDNSVEDQSVFFRVRATVEGDHLRVGKPERLFTGIFEVSDPIRSYDVAENGQFLMNRAHPLDQEQRARRAEILFPKKLIVLLGHLGGEQE